MNPTIQTTLKNLRPTDHIALVTVSGVSVVAEYHTRDKEYLMFGLAGGAGSINITDVASLSKVSRKTVLSPINSFAKKTATTHTRGRKPSTDPTCKRRVTEAVMSGHPTASRKELICKIMEATGLPLTTASTYYQNAKKMQMKGGK